MLPLNTRLKIEISPVDFPSKVVFSGDGKKSFELYYWEGGGTLSH